MKWIALAFFALTTLCSADDGAISFGGNPKMLKGHPTVRMVSERVVVTIGRSTTHYDCSFVFRNEGPARSVRMGFPDRGEGAEETTWYEDLEEAKKAKKAPPVFGNLAGFESYVNGKRVATVLVPGGDGPRSWHAKTVFFRSGETKIVRDTFDAVFGGGVTASGRWVEERRYIMSTGASWKGVIGKAEVVVRFEKGVVPMPIVPTSGDKLVGTGHSGYEYKKWAMLPKGAVVWSGFAKPTLVGRELRFVRSNFEPTDDSDIAIFFGYGSRKVD